MIAFNNDENKPCGDKNSLPQDIGNAADRVDMTPQEAVELKLDKNVSLNTPKDADQASSQVENLSTETPENKFEHFFSARESGKIGAAGTHAETAIKQADIKRVGSLTFDIDTKHFRDDFKPVLATYLTNVLSGLELRQTSIDGNLHAILHFKKPITLKRAKKIWRVVRKLVLADPNASILMKARVPGTYKVKEGERFLVQQLQAGNPVGFQETLRELEQSSVDSSGDNGAATGWERLMFEALMTTLPAANGKPLWDGTNSHGVCPLHGSGANPGQCAMHAEKASCACFADCSKDNGSPKMITLADILAARVIHDAAWPEFEKAYALATDASNGKPTVVHNKFRPLNIFYQAVMNVFVQTRKYYLQGNYICKIANGKIDTYTTPERFAGAVLSQMEIAALTENGKVYKRLSKEDASTILNNEALLKNLPEVKAVVEIPVVDDRLQFVAPGYNSESGTFCLSEEIGPRNGMKYLTQFLDVIRFRDKASRDNYLALLLTCFFLTHFCGAKPVGIFDANRPQLGKTILAKSVGALLTSHAVRTVTYTPNDEEFEKKLAAVILSSNTVIIDNAKTKRSEEVSSAVLERSVTDELLSFRQLGYNKLIERPNDVIWMITMNDVRLSPDLSDRGLPICLYFEGQPANHSSPIGDPWEFFVRHRVEIIGELMGMIKRWIDAGRPESIRFFRFRKWARWMGGILAVNGFNDFLVNLAESHTAFSPILRDLRTICETWPNQYRKAAEWLPMLKPYNLLEQEWRSSKIDRAQATAIGKLFNSYRGQTFRVTLDDGQEADGELISRSVSGGTEWGFTVKPHGPAPSPPCPSDDDEDDCGDNERDGGPCSPPKAPQPIVSAGVTDVDERNERNEHNYGPAVATTSTWPEEQPPNSPCPPGIDEQDERHETSSSSSPASQPIVISALRDRDERNEQDERNPDPTPKDIDLQCSRQRRRLGNVWGEHPAKRSLCSSSTDESAVSGCIFNNLETMNTGMNTEEAFIAVHSTTPGPVSPPTRADDRREMLKLLRGGHPTPDVSATQPTSVPCAVTTRETVLGEERIAYGLGWSQQPFANGILSLDTETTAITEEGHVPDFVLASASDGDRHMVIGPEQVADFLVVHQNRVLVFHNVAFDFAVLEKHFASVGRNDAKQVLWDMAKAGRLRDSMLLDQLVNLGRSGAQPVPRDLGKVATEWAGLQIDKTDPYRKRYAEILGMPLDQVEGGFLDYAVKDAVATIHTYAGLAHAAQNLMERHGDLYDSTLAERYGWLTESIQVWAAIALDAITRNGIHVDRDRLSSIRADLEQRRGPLAQMVEETAPSDGNGRHNSLFKRDTNGKVLLTKSGTVKTDQKAVQAALQATLEEIRLKLGRDVEVLRTPRSVALSQKANVWSPLREHHPFIDNWLTLNELGKLIQFTQTYQADRVHPRYNVLVRTGRTSCSGPNIQQLPRDGGIRECFIPSPGHVMLAVDYKYIELCTLAAVCEDRYGHSKLADAIRAGVDPHANTAAIVKGTSLEEFLALETTDAATFKSCRQQAKAVNFGVPAGLGAASLSAYAAATYSVAMEEYEAKQLKETLITKVYPEFGPYLADDLMDRLANNLGVSTEACWAVLCPDDGNREWFPNYVKNIVSGRKQRADGQEYNQEYLDETWHRLREVNTNPELAAALADQRGSEELANKLFEGDVVATLTGRIRADVSYTKKRNTPFQGLAADGAKIALFRLVDKGYRVIGFIHDEILVELPIGAEYSAQAEQITQIMCAAMEEVTGNVPVSCSPPALMDRWAKDAEAVYDHDGRLVLWTVGDE